MKARGRWGLALPGVAALLCGFTPPPQQLPREARCCLDNGRGIELEVADESHEQGKGLQMRPVLAPLRGMWFPYNPPSLARFWMHRTPEPLDMLFVLDGRVVAIEAHAKPCMNLPCHSYGPDQAVDGVLELAAGQAEAQGIRVGTSVKIEAIKAAAPSAPARD